MKEKVARKRQRIQVFGLEEEHPCVWMKAGVINFKLCDNAYDCLTCAFDKAMSRRLEAGDGRLESWRKPYLAKLYGQKECRHMLSTSVPFRFCGNAYDCATCEFDQMQEDRVLTGEIGRPAVRNVAGFYLADQTYYHRRHTWARLEHGGLVRLGVDDFAMRLLGYFNQVRLPRLGAHVEQNRPAWSLRREDKIALLVSPMDGVVVARNHEAMEAPDRAKRDPYGNGWLLVIQPTHLKRDLQELYSGDAAQNWLLAETHRLESLVAPDTDLPLAATGGEMIEDIYGNVPHLSWDRLVEEFLRP
ncbi:Glycine cleavage system H protein (lipoate-binding) [Desulfacinum hydrothermale DSM 13146]|uniref:Glycine cleavage system H protein (Lipoate-binding) n=1 Tax=Desulfacinum hydrothermale DSM 13146 TaxID=1121390 RepID=A0A1W1XI98_9BACT|nr:glycine cleavage system protein H [Desulfacinum hydrothermale]SMC23512.1 Glycine cleavage system H protein (lipoate-binding) [Desulfacinum hydrothermale DSM 13146]